MSIRPIDFNGMIQRTEDVSNLKQQQDSKPVVDQQNIQVQVEQRKDAAMHQVNSKEDSSNAQNQADARDEGKGVYYKSTVVKRKKEENKEPGRVIKKNTGGSFDMKI